MQGRRGDGAVLAVLVLVAANPPRAARLGLRLPRDDSRGTLDDSHARTDPALAFPTPPPQTKSGAQHSMSKSGAQHSAAFSAASRLLRAMSF